jgi:hypothetical protein
MMRQFETLFLGRGREGGNLRGEYNPMAIRKEHGNPEHSLNEFLAEALEAETLIIGQLGNRWAHLFRALRARRGRLQFSNESSDAAFVIDPRNGDFVFFNDGFYSLRSAVLEVVGAEASAEQEAFLVRMADVTYGLHELLHPEQGFSEFAVVQDHKKVQSGYDEIGKVDHIADNASVSLTAAVYASRTGDLSRRSYLNWLKDIAYLINRAAPIAFPIPDTALHKRKRLLVNWLVRERIDDALRHGMVAEIEQAIGPVDAALWLHFQQRTGDMVLWEPEPMHRVLGTARLRPSLLRAALDHSDEMERGDLIMAWRAILRALRVDAYSVKLRLEQKIANPAADREA